MPTKTFDAVVIGGGMAGAGVARDLALRGLSCVLVEKADFASGTTSRSSKLIHGGLRYLELLDFALVRVSPRSSSGRCPSSCPSTVGGRGASSRWASASGSTAS
jgi:glycine/D-amino acid oxidase-like deaminating enzyme